MRRFVALLPLALPVAIVVACGRAHLPGPPHVGQPTNALHEVPYPPPPARVEYVPKAPNRDAVWIDGEWIWEGRRWAWKAGRWVVPPADAAFSPWTSVRDLRGTLFVAEGTWRDRDGRPVPEPKPLLQAPTENGGESRVENGGESRAENDVGIVGIVDAGLLPPPDGSQLPDGSVIDATSELVPIVDASLPFDATARAESPTMSRP